MTRSLFSTLADDLVAALERDARADADPNIARYRADPVDWAVDVLDVPRPTLVWSSLPAYATHVWDGDPDPLATIGRALAAGRNVGVESGTGTGKTFWAACLVLWFLDCWPGIVVTAAPKEDQLKKHLWLEVARLFPRFRRRRPRAVLRSLELHVAPPPAGRRRDAATGGANARWYAVGFPVGVAADETVANRAAGFHAEHMLIVTEETQGVHPAVLAAFANTCTAPHNLRLALGNPDHQQDALHRFCVETPNTVHVRISALDHPNVVADDPGIVAGAVSRLRVEERAAQYGELAPLYRSRVRGIAPAEAAEAAIKLAWCADARLRGIALADQLGVASVSALWERRDLVLPRDVDGPPAAGVDVAGSPNGDLAAIARGRGHVCCRVDTFPCPDPTALGRRVGAEIVRQGGTDPDYIGVDAVGVGAGAVGALTADGYPVRSLVGGASPDVSWVGDGEEFLNLRAQMIWQAALDLRYGRVVLPDDEELIADLTAYTVRYRGDRKLQVEAKEVLRKQLGRSPNKGDAFIYWNWVRQVRGGATIGGTLAPW